MLSVVFRLVMGGTIEPQPPRGIQVAGSHLVHLPRPHARALKFDHRPHLARDGGLIASTWRSGTGRTGCDSRTPSHRPLRSPSTACRPWKTEAGASSSATAHLN